MKKLAILGLMLFASTTFAATNRVLDGSAITNGAATITLPTVTGTLCGINETCTLTNKTLTSPAISTPTGITKSDVGLSAVDNTSDATKNAATATLTNKTISGTTNNITSISADTSLVNQVKVANGGTGLATLTSGSVLVGAGTSNVSLVAPGTSGNILTSNGSTWTSAAAPSSIPTVTGSQASPTAIVAATGVTFSGTNYFNIQFITGSGGAVTVTASPQIAAATNVGQQLILVSTSATNTVTLADGTGLSLNGAWVGGTNSSLTLVWNGSLWYEIARR